MSSGSASYSVSATSYGRNPTDSYYLLTAPNVVNGDLEVTGNLHVVGTSALDGDVTAGADVNVVGNLTAANLASTGTLSVGELANFTGLAGVTISAEARVGAAVVAADLTMTGAGATATLTNARITTLLPLSCSAPAPASFNAAPSQWTYLFAGMRFVFGHIVTNGTSAPNPGQVGIPTPASYWSASPAGTIMCVANCYDTLVGGRSDAVRALNQGRVLGSDVLVDIFACDGAGTALGSISVQYMLVGPAQ